MPGSNLKRTATRNTWAHSGFMWKVVWRFHSNSVSFLGFTVFLLFDFPLSLCIFSFNQGVVHDLTILTTSTTSGISIL